MENTKKFDELIKTVSRRVAGEILTKSQENLVQNDTIFTGALLRSGGLELQGNKARVVYTEKYAGAIEFGSIPHAPPIEPIRRWCRIKLGDESATYPIYQKIKKEGTEPHPFIRPAIEFVKAKLHKKVLR